MDAIMDAPITGPAAVREVAEEAPSVFTLPRIRAERLTAAHLPVLQAMHHDERLMATLGGLRSDAETDEYLARNLAHWAEHGFGIWILRDPGTGRVIGRAGLRHLTVARVPEVELSYALFPEFWGRGLATDAARACVTIGRDWLGFASVVALTLRSNTASQRVLRKAALAREREVMHRGVVHVLFRSD
jgi:[ribosomal protein S5]-alanine N-acetyltransferase